MDNDEQQAGGGLDDTRRTMPESTDVKAEGYQHSSATLRGGDIRNKPKQDADASLAFFLDLLQEGLAEADPADIDLLKRAFTEDWLTGLDPEDRIPEQQLSLLHTQPPRDASGLSYRTRERVRDQVRRPVSPGEPPRDDTQGGEADHPEFRYQLEDTSFENNVLRLRAMASNLGDSADDTLRWLVDHAIPTLYALEQPGKAFAAKLTPEQRADIILVPMSRAPARLACSPFTAELFARLYGDLARTRGPDQATEREPEMDFSPGHLSSRGACADYLASMDDKSCIAQACEYYWRIISDLIEVYPRQVGGTPTDDPLLERVLHIQLNNLAARLDDLSVQSPERDRKILSLARLSVLTKAPEMKHRALADACVRAGFDVDSDDTALLATHLSGIANTPTTWSNAQVDGRPLTLAELAYLEAIAGVARIALVDASDYDDITASLFNASVTLARNQEAKKRYGGRKVEHLQAVTAGLGLWWASTLSDEDMIALIVLNGGHCGVNFLGAASNLAWRKSELDAFVDLADYLHAAIPDTATRERIKGSLRNLANVEPKRPDGKASLHELVDRALVEVISRTQDIMDDPAKGLDLELLHAKAGELEELAPRHAELVRRAFENVFTAEESDLVTRCSTLLHELGEQRAEVFKLLAQLGDEISRDGRSSPLIWLGILDEENWKVYGEEWYPEGGDISLAERLYELTAPFREEHG